MKIIAHIYTDFQSKFGVPRQSGLTDNEAAIVFEPPYRIKEAFRGIEAYSHLWLIWEFSLSKRETWSPTIRPPRLGGNARMGVFATRSPYRPNPIGLSCVRLIKADYDAPAAPILHVRGADMVDGTPIYDVKPYLAYADAYPEATEALQNDARQQLDVRIPEECAALFSPERRKVLSDVLRQDPRPAYQNDPERVYGFVFADREIKFRVKDGTATVLSTAPAPSKDDRKK